MKQQSICSSNEFAINSIKATEIVNSYGNLIRETPESSRLRVLDDVRAVFAPNYRSISIVNPRKEPRKDFYAAFNLMLKVEPLPPTTQSFQFGALRMTVTQSRVTLDHPRFPYQRQWLGEGEIRHQQRLRGRGL